MKPPIPELCDALSAELEDFSLDMAKVAKDHSGNLFSEPAKSAIRRMQRMGSLIRMIREKGSEETR